MPRIEASAADTPFGERLRTGPGYPLRGAGLASRVMLALVRHVGLPTSCIDILRRRLANRA